ncbi:predicted protein [Plenodomus lingam JN3]|uniref:Predicted protein n=1 Tax=Leptosphaeria maculans (strain JN3 / isolate v23.1.3 / race Av1-4-5-6-7-8) TaxID=985895 RepID=E5ABU5_LEPMJ|nr:predicted protein [Plenodomus lingam JN3]CBY01136.1 predicted protein [Plenodomus lingam JN3]
MNVALRKRLKKKDNMRREPARAKTEGSAKKERKGMYTYPRLIALIAHCILTPIAPRQCETLTVPSIS